MVTTSGVAMEYRVGGKWAKHSEVPVGQIRAYEMTFLRSGSQRPSKSTDGECNKDGRKDVDETMGRGRKTSGSLVAVAPCLHIVDIQPMFASESPAQVLLLILSLLKLFADLRYVFYDNACGIVRHIRRQVEERLAKDLPVDSWTLLQTLNWVIDRLHWTYHRSCRDQNSAWYVAGVNPHD